MKRNVYLPNKKNVPFFESNPLPVDCKMHDYADKAII